MSDPTELPKPARPLAFPRVPHTLRRAAVLGAGAWGTALACALQRAGIATRLWSRRADSATEINTLHHCRALSGVSLPHGLHATSVLAEAVSEAELVILAVPASATRPLAARLAGSLLPGVLVLSASKGFERDTGALMTAVLDDELGYGPLTGVITGPSFAAEVAQGHPTVLTLALGALAPAHPRLATARRVTDALVRALAQAGIRVEISADVVGAQVGGALKNQIAIACGMATGLNLGENARAGIVTRGLDDMRRLTQALGGQTETLLGSCGVGDLFLTAASSQSRNTRLGMQLGKGHTLATLAQTELAEGIHSARTVATLERDLDIRLDVAAAIRDVLDGVQSPAEAVSSLLAPPSSASFARPASVTAPAVTESAAAASPRPVLFRARTSAPGATGESNRQARQHV